MAKYTIKVTREIYFTHILYQKGIIRACSDCKVHKTDKIRSYSVNSREDVLSEMIKWINTCKSSIEFYMKSIRDSIACGASLYNLHDPLIGYSISVYRNGRHGHRTLRKTIIITSQMETENSYEWSKPYLAEALRDIKIDIKIANRCSEETSSKLYKYGADCLKNFNDITSKSLYYNFESGWDKEEYQYPISALEIPDISKMIKDYEASFISDKKYNGGIGYESMTKYDFNDIIKDCIKYVDENRTGK